jgi:hypothetical protein
MSQDAELRTLSGIADNIRMSNRNTVEVEQEHPVGGERITFGYYVASPAFLFGLAPFVATAGTGIAVIFLVDLLFGIEDVTPLIIIAIGLAFGVGGLCSVRVAWLLLGDWREYQYKYTTTRMKPHEPKPDERGRILQPIGSQSFAVTRCDWVNDWKPKLARRCFNQYGQWSRASRATRRLFESMVDDPVNLFANPTGRWNDALRDLHEAFGLTDKDGVFTDAGKAEIEKHLRLYPADNDRFPTPQYGGPVVA